jgi:hypothetical protein
MMRFDAWRVRTVCRVWLLIAENRKILTQKKDPDSKHSHRHLWRLVLLLLVALPLLPEIMIYAITALAKIKGCNVDDAKVCFIAGTQVSNIIVSSLNGGLKLAMDFATSGITAGWLAACYVIIVIGWRRLGNRLLLGLLVSVALALLPYVAPWLVTKIFVTAKCVPEIDAAGPCVFGAPVGEPAMDAVTQLWLIYPGVETALMAFVVYMVVVVILRIVSGKKSSRRRDSLRRKM